MPIISTRPHSRTRNALCCICGTLRTTTAVGGTGDRDPMYLAYCAEQGEDPGPLDRCVVLRSCVTCATTTTHAYLRVDVFRDACEDRQRQLLAEGLHAGSWDRTE